MELLQQASMPLKGKAASVAELLDRFLPGGLSAWQPAIDTNITINVPAPNLRVHLHGSAASTCTGPDANGDVDCTIAFSDVGLGFYAPNHVPLIDNTYAIGDSSIAACQPALRASGGRTSWARPTPIE